MSGLLILHGVQTEEALLSVATVWATGISTLLTWLPATLDS
jgi:hypothetical protein